VHHIFNPLNAKLNPICHLLALLGAHHIFHLSGIRVKLCFYVLAVILYTLEAFLCQKKFKKSRGEKKRAPVAYYGKKIEK